MTKQELIDCENNIIQLFEDGEIPYLTHFCGGNEEQLISIFKDINPSRPLSLSFSWRPARGIKRKNSCRQGHVSF
jgi:hypothetical protein